MQNLRWRNLESKNGIRREFCHDAPFRWLEMRRLRFFVAQTKKLSTDSSLSATDIACLYLCRFGVERMFRETQQQIAAFSYHFWSKSMPRLKRFLKKTAPLPLQSVTSPKDRERIVKTVRAAELYALISSIVMGMPSDIVRRI